MSTNGSYLEDGSLRQGAAWDESGFSAVFHAYRQMVYNIAWTYTEDAKLSEDILQDVFVVLWKNRERMAEVEHLSAYLYTIAKNRSLRVLKNLDKVRKAHDVAASLQAVQEPAHTRHFSEHRIAALLQEAMEALTPQQRKVFEYSRLHGLSREEVAEKLGISKATVSVHLTIALRTVRAFLVDRLEIFLALLLFPEFF